MNNLPPLTDPTAITCIATAAVLTGIAIFIVIKYHINLYKFRMNIQPGDYARILIDNHYYRAKLITKDCPFYKFMVLDCMKYQVVNHFHIYPL